MTEPLRVLIVEDRPDDAELVVLHLETQGFVLDWTRVEEEADYLAALESPPDVILADWTLPQFSGMRALQVLAERRLDVPFLIVSGSIGEEAAFEAVRQGAYDYVLKDRPARLGSAIERALERWRLRREREEAQAALRESEERYRRIAEMISDYAYVLRVTPQGRLEIEWASEGVREVTGYTSEELDCGGWSMLIHHDDAAMSEDRRRRLLAGNPDVSEVRIVRKDGEVRWLRTHGYPVWDHDAGRVVRIYGASQDITATKRRAQEREALAAMAEALGRTIAIDALLQDLLDAAVHAVLPAERGMILLSDPAGARQGSGELRIRAVTGHAAGRVPVTNFPVDAGYAGRAFTEGRPINVPDVGDEAAALGPGPLAVGREFATLTPSRSAILAPLLAGEQAIGVIVLENINRIAAFSEDDLSTLTTFAASAALIIERARLFETTQRRLQELDTLHRASRKLLAAQLDPEETYAAVHRAVAQVMPCEVFTISLKAATGEGYQGVYLWDRGRRYPPVDLPAGQSMSGAVAASGRTYVVNDLTAESPFPTVHFGDSESVRSLIAVPLWREGEIVGVLSAQSYQPNAYDTEHRVLLETLTAQFASAIENTYLHQRTETQARQMAQILETVPEGVLRVTEEGQVLMANPVARDDLRVLAHIEVGEVLTRLGDRPLAELLPPPPPGLWHEVRTAGRIFEVIARPVQAADRTRNWVLVIDDVTEEREVRARSERQGRLAAVGQLAAGIAHDFRNVLTATVLYAHLTLEHPDLPVTLRRNVRTIIDESNRATELVQQILDFSSRAVVEMRPLDLAEHTRHVLSVLSRTIPEDIRISVDLQAAPSGAYAVDADAGRIQQVLTNLALNARDAMPGGGELKFALSRVDRAKLPASVAPDDAAVAQAWVCLAVSDTGTGMTETVKAHLFEPFFTTKDVDKGTGLGLAQVYGIVRQHHGFIDVASTLGEGTTFSIYLPARQPEPVVDVVEVLGPTPAGNMETILLVEDQALLREAGQAVLESLNYAVLTAGNGRRALDLCQERAAAGAADMPVDLVISDFVMPVMGGADLFHELQARYPDLPVLMMTGYAVQSEQLAPLRAAGLAGVVQKPFDIDGLAREIRRILDRR